jgi:hypothetical protein
VITGEKVAGKEKHFFSLLFLSMVVCEGKATIRYMFLSFVESGETHSEEVLFTRPEFLLRI